MAKSLQPRRRKRRSAEFRNSLRLGLFLSVLTGVNVYVFFFRDSTSFRKVLQPASTAKVLVEEKKKLATALEAVSKAGPVKPTVASQVIGAPPTIAGATDIRQVEGKFGPNETLGSVLVREGLGDKAGNLVKALSRLVDPKTIQAGDGYVASFNPEGAPVGFEYAPTPVTRYVLTVGGDGSWRGRKEEKALETRVEDASGVIESSLYESIQKSGETGALVSLLVDLFAWDINFYIDTHPRDQWKVVVEKHFLGGVFYKYGNVLAAEYSGIVGTFRAFHYASGKTPGRYFDDKGHAIAKTLLKTPLRFVRISSKFDRKRFHPILHREKAHLGVDYAAPVGTPVWASAGGKVVECAMKSGSGNTVVINHGGGYATRYYHLSRFAGGLKAGKTVKQKEVIGYVGTTGLSTGPHLHFSLTQGGVFVDPSKVPMTREAPVADKAGFVSAIRPHLVRFKSLSSVLAAKK